MNIEENREWQLEKLKSDNTMLHTTIKRHIEQIKEFIEEKAKLEHTISKLVKEKYALQVKFQKLEKQTRGLSEDYKEFEKLHDLPEGSIKTIEDTKEIGKEYFQLPPEGDPQ